MENSFQKERGQYKPKVPKRLKELQALHPVDERQGASLSDDIQRLFPHTKNHTFITLRRGEKLDLHHELRVGVVLSGGQAAGGHNVIIGLFDALKELNSHNKLFGFLDGPSGIIQGKCIELSDDFLEPYRNTGGFDMIGSGRTKIETEEQFSKAETIAKELQLDGLIIIGGDDSNTNAAILAEYFLAKGVKTTVVGVPKTIDGDLKNDEIEVSFGFDTAVKTFSSTIGNILRDSLSAKKYYFFIKLMGRSASHIALECALQTHPNLTLIGEEIAEEKSTFNSIVQTIADMICKRAEKGKNYGAILIPEGVIEFIPEFKSMINELNKMPLADNERELERLQRATKFLSPKALKCFESLPTIIQTQLLIDRDPHGNVQVSKIETERLFIEAVKEELKKRKSQGKYMGKFNAQPLFCGYEGRSCYPSNFDTNYCYALGQVAALLVAHKKNGYMACVQNLGETAEEWTIRGIPLVRMLHMEQRRGKTVPVIKKALVDLQGKPYSLFHSKREQWALDDDYRYPAPIQHFGPEEITDAINITLRLEQMEKVAHQL